MTFEEDLAAAQAQPTATAVITIELNKRKHRFRFTRMDGREYAAETLRHPPRLELGLDREYGYNINSLAEAVAPRCSVLLEGKDAEETVLTEEQWAAIFSVADGGAIQSIVNTVFALNEFASSKAVEAAKKVLDGSLLTSD